MLGQYRKTPIYNQTVGNSSSKLALNSGWLNEWPPRLDQTTPWTTLFKILESALHHHDLASLSESPDLRIMSSHYVGVLFFDETRERSFFFLDPPVQLIH